MLVHSEYNCKRLLATKMLRYMLLGYSGWTRVYSLSHSHLCSSLLVDSFPWHRKIECYCVEYEIKAQTHCLCCIRNSMCSDRELKIKTILCSHTLTEKDRKKLKYQIGTRAHGLYWHNRQIYTWHNGSLITVVQRKCAYALPPSSARIQHYSNER